MYKLVSLTVGHNVVGLTYILPAAETVEEYMSICIHTGTSGVDHHRDRRANIAPGLALGVCFMEPDAHWDVVCVT